MSKERTLIEDLPVIRPTPLSMAISALIAAPAATAVAQDQDEASGDTMLEEVTVTAQRVEQSVLKCLQKRPKRIRKSSIVSFLSFPYLQRRGAGLIVGLDLALGPRLPELLEERVDDLKH